LLKFDSIEKWMRSLSSWNRIMKNFYTNPTHWLYQCKLNRISFYIYIQKSGRIVTSKNSVFLKTLKGCNDYKKSDRDSDKPRRGDTIKTNREPIVPLMIIYWRLLPLLY